MPESSQALIPAMHALIRLINIWKLGNAQLSDEEIAASYDAYSQFVLITDHLIELRIPKRHVMVHTILHLQEFGNPCEYANWFDEALNKTLRRMCACASQQTFETALLHRIPVVLESIAATGEPKTIF